MTVSRTGTAWWIGAEFCWCLAFLRMTAVRNAAPRCALPSDLASPVELLNRRMGSCRTFIEGTA